MLAEDTKVVSPISDFVGSCWDLDLPDLHNKTRLHPTPNEISPVFITTFCNLYWFPLRRFLYNFMPCMFFR